MSETKVISFHGATFTVPVWARFIAVNADTIKGGQVIVYSHRPYRGKYGFKRKYGQFKVISRIRLPGWRRSLRGI